jgi:tRNA threonylcarbamoyladenosine biosynthesis protein TsaE
MKIAMTKKNNFSAGFITENSKQTQKLGEMLALELRGGEILCLDGDLGAGKTTFTQGLLKGLKVKGPYTSPTFLIMKEYRKKDRNIYHIDAYRINEEDLLNLGWKEIVADKKNVVIVEWSERIKKILPDNVVKIHFEWLDENKRKIIFN